MKACRLLLISATALMLSTAALAIDLQPPLDGYIASPDTTPLILREYEVARPVSPAPRQPELPVRPIGPDAGSDVGDVVTPGGGSAVSTTAARADFRGSFSGNLVRPDDNLIDVQNQAVRAARRALDD